MYEKEKYHNFYCHFSNGPRLGRRILVLNRATFRYWRNGNVTFTSWYSL